MIKKEIINDYHIKNNKTKKNKTIDKKKKRSPLIKKN